MKMMEEFLMPNISMEKSLWHQPPESATGHPTNSQQVSMAKAREK